MSPTCETAGVLAAAVNIVASWQANEAIKILTKNFDAVSPFLFSFDLWDNRFQQLNISHIRDEADCPVCKRKDYEYLDGKFASSTTTLCGRNAVQISIPNSGKMNFEQLAAKLQSVGSPSFNRFMLKCTITEGERENRREFELTLFSDGRAIIKGTNDAKTARAIYSKYVGM